MEKICALLSSVQVQTTSSREQSLYNLAERATSVILEQFPLPPVNAEQVVHGVVLRYLRQAADLEGA